MFGLQLLPVWVLPFPLYVSSSTAIPSSAATFIVSTRRCRDKVETGKTAGDYIKEQDWMRI
jgi:hypothetical protein